LKQCLTERKGLDHVITSIIDARMEAQRGEIACSKLHTKYVMKPEFNLRVIRFKAPLLP
jgi:hypothetical protein